MPVLPAASASACAAAVRRSTPCVLGMDWICVLGMYSGYIEDLRCVQEGCMRGVRGVCEGCIMSVLGVYAGCIRMG
jgi:hypothetical protein